jgi:tRNA nucleotidyltransferase (CCA-adding enzyme)
MPICAYLGLQAVAIRQVGCNLMACMQWLIDERKLGVKNANTVPDNHLTIITTHVNADFDALASMLAAQKLYPDSLVVFPGSQEKNLRNFFIQSMVYLYNLADIKDLDFSRVERLVLVDTRQASRIGKLAELLDRDNLEIHTYDHHPLKSDDIQGNFEVHCRVGATVTILTEILIQKQIPVSSEEATIMCLGIYEDTGSFTFPSTTQRDLSAAAFLIGRGANINIISSMIAREISPEQVGFLNDLIQAATTYNINGLEIVISALTLNDYLPDFAFLVHKMVKMENINAIFALAQMENKIYLVARSRSPEIDVGAVVSQLGGGGHMYAAAATIKGKTLTQVEQELFQVLTREIKSRRQARHLMSSPAITVDAEVCCSDARQLLTRYNINALLVVASNSGQESLLGYISRQVIEKAIYHKLGQAPVKDYMTTEVAVAGPEADLLEIQNKIIENKQRLVPIVDHDKIAGVITRTDLLNILVQQSQLTSGSAPDPLKDPIHARTRNILHFMKERLSERIMRILQTIGQIAEEIGFEAYVIGGFVRDLFLYRVNEDLDIVIEGDGIAFAKEYAAQFGARVHSHRKFGTAVIVFADNFKIDVASARMEYYKFPAALPDVEMSSIKLDLFRRDFTINTLAIQLNPERLGRLIDFFSAQKDIKDKAIRVLHNLSFVEDPTRVFRAIRFEQRFGFAIGKLTSSLIENAVKMDFFKRLSGRRVFTELRHILEEENPAPAIFRLQDYDLLKVIHPSIILDKELIKHFNSVKEVISWHDLLFLEESYMKWAVYFMALIRHCDRQCSQEICRRLELAPRLEKLFCGERLDCESGLFWLEQNSDAPNNVLYQRLSGFRTELILYMMACADSKKVKKAISRYYTRLRNVKISISGKDIQALGVKPGPVYRDALDAVLAAKLNGKVKSRNDEMAFIKRHISGNKVKADALAENRDAS